MKKLVVDSSVWIEIFAGKAKAPACQSHIAKAELCYVPTLVVYEVYRKVAQYVGESEALEAVSYLQKQCVVDLSTETALTAADLSLTHGLAMADSIVLAHARDLGASLLTLDNDFRDLKAVILVS